MPIRAAAAGLGMRTRLPPKRISPAESGSAPMIARAVSATALGRPGVLDTDSVLPELVLHADPTALADLRDTAESYARVRTAALLLRRAVDRYRQEQQGPLLRRAAELFGTLTLGNYTGLKVEFDDRDQAILKGERRTGALVDVSGMSDGTRDQLFLALRVAAIELYVAGAEPIPFVADDLLVNYDDDRAAAALSVLHDLSRQTQVLFFTHHSHLCDVAKRRLGTGALKVHALDQVVPA